MPDEMVDVYELILEFVRNFPHPKDVRAKVNLKDIKPADIDVSNLQIRHQTTSHEADSSDAVPQSHVLFASTFTNNTTEEQTYSLRAERRTQSSCRVSVNRAITMGGEISLKLTAPASVLEAAAGFKRELTVGKSDENAFEEEVTWSVDSPVKVAQGQKTTASLVITECEYRGTFEVVTSLEGRIVVNLRRKRDNTVISTLPIEDIRNVFTKERGFEHVGRSAVTFTSTGTCACRMGLRQDIDMQQDPL